MATTLENLVLAQLAYHDLRTFALNNVKLSQDNLTGDIIDDLYKDFKGVYTKHQLKEVISNFKVVSSVREKTAENEDCQDEGFYAVAFERTSDGGLGRKAGEVICAIRGSDPSLNDKDKDPENWEYDWLETNLGELPLPSSKQGSFKRFNKAKAFIEVVKNKVGTNTNINLTGHSMGGAIAQKLAVFLTDSGDKVKCETFNAPGMLHALTEGQQRKNEQGLYDIVNNVNASDKVGNFDAFAEMALYASDLLIKIIISGTIGTGRLDLYYKFMDILETEAGKSIIRMLDTYLTNDEYKKDFMKHVGTTNYIGGASAFLGEKEPIKHLGKTYEYYPTVKDSHGLYCFENVIDSKTGNIVSLEGVNITTTDGFDKVIGTAGNDKFNLEGGNDIVTGGKGNDELNGGLGNDTYIFRKGDGRDTISDFIYERPEEHGVRIENAGTDTIILKDIKISSLKKVYKKGNNLVLDLGNRGDQITIKNYYLENKGRSVEKIRFANNVVKNLKDIEPAKTSMLTMESTVVLPQYLGLATEEEDEGYLVNIKDWLSGAIDADNDELGDADDESSVDPNTESVVTTKLTYGDTKNNKIFGSNADDYVYAAEGNDVVYLKDGNNIVSGGKGDDKLHGGVNCDVYIYEFGDGHDIIEDTLGTDGLTFQGIEKSKITFEVIKTGSQQGSVKFNLPDGSITIRNYYKIVTDTDGKLDYQKGTGCIEQICILREDGKEEYITLDPYTEKIKVNLIEDIQESLVKNLDDINLQYTGTKNIRPYDPLLIDLDGDGFETTTVAAGTYFDMNADGLIEKTAWIDKDDGLLVRDIDNDGYIKNGTELFGDKSLKKDGLVAKTGFEALTSFDDNADGVIDNSDGIFAELKIWKDINRDGVSDETELMNLEEAGIQSISLNRNSNTSTFSNGNVLTGDAQVNKNDGTVIKIGEFNLVNNLRDSLGKGTPLLSNLVTYLPEVFASGSLCTLREKMEENNKSLIEAVIDYTEAKSIDEAFQKLDTILFAWSDGLDINQSSRGQFIDARQLNFVEKFMGSEFVSAFGRNPISVAADSIKQQYAAIKQLVHAKLLTQTHLSDYWEALEISEVERIQFANIEGVTRLIEEDLATKGIEGQNKLYEFLKVINNLNVKAFIDYDGFVNKFNKMQELQWVFDNLNSQTIYGTEVCEVINGLSGNDIIFGFNGNDTIYGNGGNDTIIGGTLNDNLYGGSGSDTYEFNSNFGQDIVYDSIGPNGSEKTKFRFTDVPANEVKFTASNNDLILSVEGTENQVTMKDFFVGDSNLISEICFSDGVVLTQQEIISKFSIIERNGTIGNDVIHGSGLLSIEEKIYGLDGNDILYGNEGKDTLYGDLGDDYLNGGSDDDALYGGMGNDTLKGYNGNDYLDGGAGDDQLNGGYGADTYIFGSDFGRDIVIDLSSEAGPDVTKFQFTEITADKIIFKMINNDLILSIEGTENQVTMKDFFVGDNNLISEICFSDGVVITQDEIASKFLKIERNGTEMNDAICGSGLLEVVDIIHGNGGDDSIYGNAGDDILNGGTGNDTLVGGVGNDIYEFSRGFGKDTIADYATKVVNVKGVIKDVIDDGKDVLKFTDIASTELLPFSRSTNGLLLKVANSTDQITIQNYFDSDSYKVEEIQFSDGVSWNKGYISSQVIVYEGTSNSDTLYGLNNVSVKELIKGGTGNDSLYGYSGDDTLDGGVGNDYLNGGYGNDTYTFSRGFGQDTISDYFSGYVPNKDYMYDNGTDVVKFTDIASTEVSASIQNGSDLVLNVANSGDQVTIKNYFSGDIYKVDQIQFSDGIVWDKASLQLGNLNAIGTESSETINGNEGNNIMKGMGGDDTIYGNVGDDTLNGGTGNDTLVGGAGNDTYEFSRGFGEDTIVDEATKVVNGIAVTDDGKDVLKFTDIASTDLLHLNRNGNHLVLKVANSTDQVTIKSYFLDDSNKVEEIQFSDGIVWNKEYISSQVIVYEGTSNKDVLYGLNNESVKELIKGGMGNDSLYGNSGEDILEGGVGNDYLNGGYGNDTYTFSRGFGQDTISDYFSGYVPNKGYMYDNGTDVVKFTDITSTEVSASIQNGLDLVLNVANSGDQVTIKNYFSGDIYKVDQIQFSDGVVWDKASLQSGNLNAIGTESSENINGNDGSNILKGMGGDDSIYGNAGDDTLNGGTGNDTLVGGAGNDTYEFSRGFGKDTIVDEATKVVNGIAVTDDGKDVLKFTDIASTDLLHFNRNGNHLVLKVANSTDQVTIKSYFLDDSNKVEEIQFSDGIVWNKEYISSQAIVYEGTSNDDLLYGLDTESVKELIRGGLGNDRLFGNIGDDTLDGGVGNDYLEGGSGNDTYTFSRGFGQDTINDYWYNYDPNKGYLHDNGIDFVTFIDIASTEVSISIENVSDLVLRVTDSSDQVTIQNYFRDEDYKVDRIQFSDGVIWDKEFIQSKDLNAIGTEQSEIIMGTDGSNILKGNGGDDFIDGKCGDDNLNGGMGDDNLVGGKGNDTYEFSSGFGKDTIVDYSTIVVNGVPIRDDGKDVVKFTDIASTELLPLSRSDYDLVLKIADRGDQIRIYNYFGDDTYKIEEIQFSDGVVWDRGYINSQQIIYEGTSNNDSLYGLDTESVKELINGGSGDDTLYGNCGDDTLDGGDGNDYLEGGYGNDTYTFSRGFGQDTIKDYWYGYDSDKGYMYDNGTDVVKFTDITSTEILPLGRNGYDLFLNVANSNDQITIQNYFIDDNFRVNEIQFSDGIVWDREYINSHQIVYEGTSNNDSLYGMDTESGKELIKGGLGNDTILGYSGDDTLDGGIGNDYLEGGYDNDTYTFSRGFGQDVINDYWYGYDSKKGYSYDNGVDVVKFTDIASTEVSASIQNRLNLVLSIAGSSDQVTLQNYFRGEHYKVDQIQFSDGVIWDIESLKSKNLNVIGTEWSDVISGTEGDNILKGMGGSDFIDGLDGDDTLDGGTGEDILIGGSGNDTYIFSRGFGQDTISDYWYGYVPNKGYSYDNGIDVVKFTDIASTDVSGTIQNGSDLVLSIVDSGDQLTLKNYFTDEHYKVDQIQFSDGFVWDKASLQSKNLNAIGTEASEGLYGNDGNNIMYGMGGNDSINGMSGDDTLDGGVGIDYLEGGYGNDTYTFSRGFGQDIVNDYWYDNDSNEGYQYDNGMDMVTFTDISSTDVCVSIQNGSDLVLSVADSWDQVTLQNYFTNEYYKVDKIQFSDGATWGKLGLESGNLNATGTETLDLIIGTEGDNVLNGMGGNDFIDGCDGDDIIDGGTGYDNLVGGAGNDIYEFTRGFGKDQIDDYAMKIVDDIIVTENDWDIVKFIDIASTELMSISRSSYDLVLKIFNSNDQVTIQSYFADDSYKVNEIQFSDGVVWDREYINSQKVVYEGTSNNDSLNGLDIEVGKEFIKGGLGDDSLYGNSGDDILDGGAGNDYLEGGYGNDTYTFSRGFDQDIINDFWYGYNSDKGDIYDNGTDLVKFIDIASTDVSTSIQNGSDLVLSVAESNDQVTLQNYFGDEHYKVDQIQFSDGVIWDIESLKSRNLNVLGTEWSDFIIGTDGDNILKGMGGDDSLFGKDGDDILDGGTGFNTLDGGSGNDILIGGEGYDIYEFKDHFGSDTIYNNTTGEIDYDCVHFDYDYTKLVISKIGSNLNVKIAGQTDNVTVQNWNLDGSSVIDEVSDATGYRIIADKVDQLIQEMAIFTSSKGLSWEQAAQQNEQQYIEILSSYYQHAVPQ